MPVKSTRAASFCAQIKIFKVPIDNSNWTAITLPSNVDCDSAFGKCRSATNAWKMADNNNPGEDYVSWPPGASWTLDIAKKMGETLYYVKGSEASDTFELVLGIGYGQDEQ